jgi:hypothetical protein
LAWWFAEVADVLKVCEVTRKLLLR